jgi:hypothetical protein
MDPNKQVVRQPFDLASARAAAARDQTACWVGDFLASRGSDNLLLAAALAQRQHWWVGPIEVSLDELVRLAGPESNAPIRVPKANWEADVRAITISIDDGWQPPPLLAAYRDGHLLLQDGNHRYEALERRGEHSAWVIIYFDTRDERDEFLARRKPLE